MPPTIFYFILNKVTPYISRQDSQLRECISAGLNFYCSAYEYIVVIGIRYHSKMYFNISLPDLSCLMLNYFVKGLKQSILFHIFAIHFSHIV